MYIALFKLGLGVESDLTYWKIAQEAMVAFSVFSRWTSLALTLTHPLRLP